MAVTPSQRTLSYLRKQGWAHVETVERWIPQARRRKDLFRFADILAIHPQWGHLYVQATSGSHVNARLEKMRIFARQEIEDVIMTESRVEIHGWRKLKNMGRKQWFPIIKNIGMNEIYDMNKDAWAIAHEYMVEAARFIEAERVEDKFRVDTWVDNYPPCIMFDVTVDHNASTVPDITKKERERIGTVIAEMCEDAIDNFPFLVVKLRPPVAVDTMRYRLIPKEFHDVPGVVDVL
jgi:hypothetical protein